MGAPVLKIRCSSPFPSDKITFIIFTFPFPLLTALGQQNFGKTSFTRGTSFVSSTSPSISFSSTTSASENCKISFPFPPLSLPLFLVPPVLSDTPLRFFPDGTLPWLPDNGHLQILEYPLL